MFGIFCNKSIKRIIKSLDVDHSHWRLDPYGSTFVNDKNDIIFHLYHKDGMDVHDLHINQQNAHFLLTKYNKKYLIKAIKKWISRKNSEVEDSFIIKISTEEPEDFI